MTEWQLPCHCNVNATLPCARVPVLTWKTIVGRKAVDSSLHVEANVEASASVTHTLMKTSRNPRIINEDDPFNITDDPHSIGEDDHFNITDDPFSIEDSGC